MACVRRAYRLISLSLSVGFLRFDGAAAVVDGAVVVAVVASRWRCCCGCCSQSISAVCSWGNGRKVFRSV